MTSWLIDLVEFLFSRLGIVDCLCRICCILFLLQYDVDPVFRVAVKYLYGGLPVSCTEFYISREGICSMDVVEVFELLHDRGIVEFHEPGHCPRKIVYRGKTVDLEDTSIPNIVRSRLELALNCYGIYESWKLIRKIRNMLRLNIPEKHSYYIGWSIDNYLIDDGFKFMKLDLANMEKTIYCRER